MLTVPACPVPGCSRPAHGIVAERRSSYPVGGEHWTLLVCFSAHGPDGVRAWAAAERPGWSSAICVDCDDLVPVWPEPIHGDLCAVCWSPLISGRPDV